MRGVLPAVALVACDRAATERPPSPPPVVAPIVRDAAVVVDAQPVDALPVDLVTAPAQIARTISTGQIVQHHKATTYTLQIAGSNALLAVRTERGVPGDMLGLVIERWEHLENKIEVGTVAVSGKTTTLTFEGGRVLTCTAATGQVARAGATRRPPVRPTPEGCGDEGRWDPGGLTRVAVLRCDDELSFAPAPGIEWVYVNDDCSMQGGGWRHIAKDGSIAPIRHPKDIKQ